MHRYAALGLKLIPLYGIKFGNCECAKGSACSSKGKHPRFKNWPKEASSDPEALSKWAAAWPYMNVGIVTGAASGVIVVDVDGDDGLISVKKKTEGKAPITWTAMTGRGRHFYFRHPETSVKNRAAIFPHVDLRGDGGYVVAPPSTHASGVRYSWAPGSGQDDIDLAYAPDWLFELILGEDSENTASIGDGEIVEGTRNETLFRLGCRIRKQGLEREAIKKELAEQNAKAKPPLEDAEIEAIIESVMKYPPGNKSTAETLVQIGLECLLFKDERGDYCAQYSVGGHTEQAACRSQSFKRWLMSEYYQRTRAVPGSEAVSSAIHIIEAHADFGGTQNSMNERVARCADTVYYDLVDKEWRAVEIDSRGWRIVNSSPALFRRHPHQLPQRVPIRGGAVAEVLKFVNIKNPDEQLLFMVVLVSSLIPGFPHPVVIPHGEAGAAKSTLLRVMRRLIDPSLLELLTLPKDRGELVQQLSHHWTAYYDNLSRLSKEQSDALCRAVTGEGVSKRRLYHDDDDIISAYKRCIGLNGINVVATQGDLLDRAILFSLERLPENKRPEERFWADFEAARPRIFGAMLQAVAAAIRLRTEAPVQFRMADFAQWGRAIALALGKSKDDFEAAYLRNISRHNEEALNNSPVALAVILHMSLRDDEWRGTPSELYRVLTDLAKQQLHLAEYGSGWPKAPQFLTKRLNEIKPNLRRRGILITEVRGDERIICLEHLPEFRGRTAGSVGIVDASAEDPDGTDAPDDAEGGA
jgi:hypothetical protein